MTAGSEADGVPAATNEPGPDAPIGPSDPSDGRRDLAGAAALWFRSLAPTVPVLLLAVAAMAVALIPLYIWSANAALLLGFADEARTTPRQLTQLMIAILVPLAIVAALLTAAVVGAISIIVARVAQGLPARPVGAFRAAFRASPRLLVVLAVAVGAILASFVLTPFLVAAGLAALVLTPLVRGVQRLRPGLPWPATRHLVVVAVPFGVTAALIIRLALVLPVVAIERGSIRTGFARSVVLTRSHARRIALVAVAFFVIPVALLGVLNSQVLDGASSLIGPQVVSTAASLIVLTLNVAATAYLFTQLGEPADLAFVEAPPPGRTRSTGILLVLAVLAAAVPVSLVLPRPAPAAAAGAVSGATLVVTDLGDASDAAPGDGVCDTGTGACTLRAAIEEVNDPPPPPIDPEEEPAPLPVEVIGFAVSGTITVASPLFLRLPVTIDATGAAVTVSGGGSVRVFQTAMEISGGGSATLRALTIAHGYDAVDGGGAIYNSGASGGEGLVLDRVTVRNTVTASGAQLGGAVVNLTRLTIRNSTFFGNQAPVSIEGSDVANVFSGRASISQSTFAGSTGSSAISSTGDFPAEISNSIVSGPGFACDGTFAGSGNVTIDADAICPGTAGATTTTLGLVALADNGGATASVRLLPSSVAVDAADGASCSATDQRGATRPKGAGCDAGAYELDPATATSLTATPASAPVGSPVVLDAKVVATGEPVVPTGSVELFDGATSLGTVPLDSTGAASKPVTTLGTGPHSLTATYRPDSRLADSTSAAQAVSVERATPTVVLTSTGSPTGGGEAVTFTIAVSGAPGVVPTGSVTLRDGTATVETEPLDGAGRAQVTTSTLGGGPHVMVADYGGDARYAPASSAALAHEVVGGTTIQLRGPSAGTVYGNEAAFDVEVASGVGGRTPTGGVALVAGTTTVGLGALDGSGKATIRVSDLPAGDNVLVAVYGGDSFNGASVSPSVTHRVTPADTTTSLVVSPVGSNVYGTPLTVEVEVTASGTPAVPSGTVTLYDGATALYGIVLQPDGTASSTLPTLPAGTHHLRAEYNGPAGFRTSTAPTVDHEVLPARSAVSLTAGSPTSVSGEQVSLTARVTSPDSPAKPTGSVTFRDGTTELGTAAVTAAGTATLDTRAIAVGSRTITATFDGGGDFRTATSPSLTHTVDRAAVQVAVSSTPTRSWYGSAVIVDVVVAADAPGTGIPTGTVSVGDGASVLGTPTLDSTGRTSLVVSRIAVGTRTLRADYGGDAAFRPGSGSATHLVDPDTTTVTVLTSEPDQLYGRPTTLTAAVVGTGSATPSGTVTFTAAGRTLGTPSLDGSGRASVTVADLPVGSTLVTAAYAGDGSFTAGTGQRFQQVGAGPTATSLVVAPSAPAVTDTVTLTAMVAAPGASLVPSGSVGFYDNDVLLAVVPVDSAGKATFAKQFDRASHELQARFAATSSWQASASARQTVVPGRVGTTLSVGADPDPATVGRPVTLVAAIPTSPGAAAPTGVIHFTDASGSLGSAPITDGVATLEVAAPLTPGPWIVSAWYPGDLSYEPVAPTSVTVGVEALPTSVIVVTAPNPAYALDGPVTVRALVVSDPGGPPVTGRVRFTSDSPVLSSETAAVDADGFADITVRDVPAGTWHVQAEYLPAAGSPYSGSQGGTTHTSVKRASTVTIGAVTGLEAGRTTTVPVAVTIPGGSAELATGTIVVSAGNGISCTVAAPIGSCNLVVPTTGPVTITAVYPGDARYLGSTRSFSGTVTAAAPTLRASSPTRPWVTGDPITIDWTLAGPTSGSVVVRSPFGVACTVPAAPAGSCTATLPFGARGAAIDFDVAYSGDGTWAPAFATVSGTPLGCFPRVLEALPSGGGTVAGPPGNCNRGGGYVDGTRVIALAQPAPGYVLTRWLEDDSTALARAFVVGEDTNTATALFALDCVTVTSRAAQAPGVDPLGSAAGSVALTPAGDCGVPDAFDPATGTTTSRHQRGSTVEASAVSSSPDTGEFKGWIVNRSDGSSSYPVEATVGLTLTDDIDLTANFGARCYEPELVPDGPGTAQIATAPNCFDADGPGYLFGTFVAIEAQPDPLHYVGEITTPSLGTIDPTVFGIRSDDPVTVHFEPCRKLTTATSGSGKGEVRVSVESTCPDGAPGYYVPGEVALEAIPSPAGTGAFGLPIDGDRFERWVGNGGEPIYERSNPIRIDMSEDRDVTAVFTSATHCATITVGTGSPGWIGNVTITQDPAYECGAGQYYQGKPFTLGADVLEGSPLTQWEVVGLGDYESAAISGKSTRAPDRTRHRTRLGSGTVEVAPMYGDVTAKAYACTAVNAEAGILGKDGNIVEGADAPENFVLYDTEPSCPGTSNGWLVGDRLGYFAGAQPVGWEFAGWQGDAEGRSPEGRLALDGTRSNLMIRSLYRPICFTLTVTPPEHTYLGMEPDCPESEPSDNRFMGGSTIALHAAGGGEVFVGWEGDVARKENPTWVYLDQDSHAHATWRNRTDKEKTVKFFNDLADGLAVGAKKLLGVGILAVNALISNTATLALSAISLAATAIDAIAGALGEPTDGKFREVLTGIQQTADLWSSPFSCGAEWAFGSGDSQAGNGGDLKDVIKDPLKMGQKLGSYRASLEAAGEGSGKYVAAIKRFGVRANAAKSVGTLGLTAYGVGNALASDDLGWDDTAEEAWGSAGGRAFLQCMDRAIPDYMGIPPLDVQGT